MMKTVSLWSTIIVLSAGAAGVLTQVASFGPVRVMAVMWFLLVCPGMMLVRGFHLDEPLLEWVLAIVLSLVVDSGVAGVLLYCGRWSPSSAFALLIVFSVGGALVQELNAVRVKRGLVAQELHSVSIQRGKQLA
jgi:hypothetical protein